MARKKLEVSKTAGGLPQDYAAFLESLKTRVRQGQTKAMLSVNRELIQLYWDIGRLIVERQDIEGGAKVLSIAWRETFSAPFPASRDFRHSTSGECGRSSWRIASRRKNCHSL